ncbi:hypothetical protein HPP92_021076 [Vanilla planifolia]|uniref:Uncharacterized protein n=1 Tax=Vanilla planifolia TaxID=51239 RepID=A0A835UF67_VANPL|nr:hypothetical protein HPP92_021076 [Vanilla planifolia]
MCGRVGGAQSCGCTAGCGGGLSLWSALGCYGRNRSAVSAQLASRHGLMWVRTAQQFDTDLFGSAGVNVARRRSVQVELSRRG